MKTIESILSLTPVAYLAAVMVAVALLTFMWTSGEHFLFFWFCLKARRAARRVRDAGFTKEAIEAAERDLLTSWYVTKGVIDPRLTREALEYLRIVGDAGKSPQRGMAVALLVAMVADSILLASMVADTVLIDGSINDRLLLSAIVGVIGGLLAGGITHVAGERLARSTARKAARRWAFARGIQLADDAISINQPQAVDAGTDFYVRKWARMEPADSLWPVKAAVVYVIAVGVGGFSLRLEQLATLRLQNVPDLPTISESLTGLSVLFLIFVALQAGMGWLAYSTALLGRESKYALRMTRDGGLRTMVEVARYHAYLIARGRQLQARLHELISDWNIHCGNERTRSVLDAAEVLKECMANNDNESPPSASAPVTEEEEFAP